jgi:serine/threonine protein kinase
MTAQTAAVSSHQGSLDGQSPESLERPGDLALIAQISNHTWLGRFADGGLVAARPILPPTDRVDWAGDLAASSARHLVPVLGVASVEGRVWLVSELDCGVPLRRFLQVARLSHRQAMLIAIDVLTALESLHASGHVHTRVHANTCTLGQRARHGLGIGPSLPSSAIQHRRNDGGRTSPPPPPWWARSRARRVRRQKRPTTSPRTP